MQKEAADEAKRAAAAMADEVKASAQPPDVKGAVDGMLAAKMADLKREVDGELQDQMQVGRVRADLKREVDGELQDQMQVGRGRAEDDEGHELMDGITDSWTLTGDS